MKRAIAVVFTLLSPVAFAVGTNVSSGVSGTGAQIIGVANQTLGDKTATIAVSNGTAPSLTVTPGGAGPGVNAGTASFGLSVGAVLGGGFGAAGGTAGTQAGKQ